MYVCSAVIGFDSTIQLTQDVVSFYCPITKFVKLIAIFVEYYLVLMIHLDRSYIDMHTLYSKFYEL